MATYTIQQLLRKIWAKCGSVAQQLARGLEGAMGLGRWIEMATVTCVGEMYLIPISHAFVFYFYFILFFLREILFVFLSYNLTYPFLKIFNT